jgi:O-antigen ligase
MRRLLEQHLPKLSVVPAAFFLFILPLNHTNALRLTALFLSGAVALHYALRHPVPRFPAKAALALWAGLALLSVSWSADPAFSLGEFKTEIIYGMIAFASLFVLIRDRVRWQIALLSALLGVALTLLIALAHYGSAGLAASYDWDWQHGAISYSTYLATISPLLIYSLLYPWRMKWARPLLLVLACAFLFVGYKTGNRMLWLSVAGSGLLFIALAWMKMRGSRGARTVAVAALAGIALAALMFILVAQQRVINPLQSQAAAGGPMAHVESTFTRSERYEIWRYWLGHIRENPWTGVGFGRDLPHMVYEKPAEWFDLMFAHAHNLFLDYALQLGIPGVVALLILLGALGREFIRLYRQQHHEAWMIGGCGLALLLAMVSKNMTDDLFWRTDALLFWALKGALLGYGARLGTAPPATEHERPKS